MKKIAFVNFDMSDTGGSQQVLSNMALALKDEYEIHVISLKISKSDWAYEFPKEIRRYTVLSKDARIREVIHGGKKAFREYIRKHGFDSLFYIGAYAGLCGGILGRKERCKKVFCDHGALMNQWNELPARLMRIFGSKFSNYTIVLTKQSEQAYYDKFHYKNGRVRTIYNWMDDSILKDAGDYDQTSKTLLTAGRFSHEKGYDLLVQVAKKLDNLVTDWQWDIYGEGDEFENIKRQLTENGLSEKVKLLGLTNEMSRQYVNHAIYVMTSYREGLPLVLLEAKANHLPIVSFDIVSGPGEIVEDGVNGVLIEPYDTGKMAGVIAELLKDQARRVSMAEKSSLGVEKFEKKKILAQWREFIEEITD